MRILLLEDTEREVERVKSLLGKEMPEASLTVIRSEEEFVGGVSEILLNPPDCAVVDLVMEWSAQRRGASAPASYPRVGGNARAGLRCCKVLADSPEMHGIPLLLYSLFERGEAESEGPLPAGVYYLQKRDGTELIRWLQSASALKDRAGYSGGRVFVVHGHDRQAEIELTDLLKESGLSPVLLRDVVQPGLPWLESLLKARVDYAVVLLTPDDEGRALDEQVQLRPRARQNVIFELGFLVARLGLGKVCALRKGEVELPTDYVGVHFLEMDKAGGWRFSLLRAMKRAGLTVTIH